MKKCVTLVCIIAVLTAVRSADNAAPNSDRAHKIEAIIKQGAIEKLTPEHYPVAPQLSVKC